MTSRERIIKASKGNSTDVVPVAPYMGNYGARIAGVPISQYNTCGKRMAQAQLRAWEIHQQDVVVAQSDNYYIAEGFGCITNQPYDSTPYLEKPAIDDINEITKLKIPDPLKDGRMPVYLEAVNLLKHKLNGQVAVRGPGTGPFSLAGHILGTEKFLMEIALAEAEDDCEKKKQIHELMELTSDALIKFLTELVKAGSDFAVVGDSLASLDMISPKYYYNYVFQYEKKVFDKLKPICEKHNAVTLLHICGDTTKIFPKICETGADIFECDYKVNLKEFKEISRGRVSLMGNIDPSSILLMGNENDVTNAAWKCMDDAAGSGFILGSGCEVAMDTPQENIKAMVNAARNYKL